MKRILYVISIILVIASGSALPEAIWAQTNPEAGFYTLESRDFYFHTDSYFNRMALRSSPARVWYVYQPADENPASKPLFVFFNGGPGGATSAGLLSAYTGRKAVTVDPATGTATIEPNPSSWTRIGNLLHIDMRTTGFSYSLMDNPQDDGLRAAEYDAQHYNPYADAADFVLLVLRFLADHPALRSNRVVIVGESYGGIRSLTMLHLLLYYPQYGDGRAVYQDPELVGEIQNHYNAVFPDYAGQEVPPAVVARQFGHQVLIQPAVSRDYQRQIAAEMLEAPGSIMDQLAEETGVPYIRWLDKPESGGTSTPYRVMNNIYDYLEEIDRDPYIYIKKDGFFWGFFSASSNLLSHYGTLNEMTGVDTAGIGEMYASARGSAYKYRGQGQTEIQVRSSALMGPGSTQQTHIFNPDTSSDDRLESVFGLLQPWDGYFIDLNYDVSDAFYYNRALFYGYDIYYTNTPRYGRMFLEGAAWVHTFITDAAFDIVVYSPGLPAALALHTDMLYGTEHDTGGPPGEARPGQIRLRYRPSVVPGSAVTQSVIRFPFYAHSGHAVTLTEPEEILVDVIAWLRGTGFTVTDSKGEVR
jgi:hypothetical protein